MIYKTPNALLWEDLDEKTLIRLATQAAAGGRIMRTEPNNSGFRMEDAVQILASLAKDDEDVSDLIPDDLR